MEFTAGKRGGNCVVLAHETPLSDAEKVSWRKPCADDLQLGLRRVVNRRRQKGRGKKKKNERKKEGWVSSEKNDRGREKKEGRNRH